MKIQQSQKYLPAALVGRYSNRRSLARGESELDNPGQRWWVLGSLMKTEDTIVLGEYGPVGESGGILDDREMRNVSIATSLAYGGFICCCNCWGDSRSSYD